MNDFIFLLACIGLTYIIVDSTIMEKARSFFMGSSPESLRWKMLVCYGCTGFHVGWFLYLLRSVGGFFILMLFYALASTAVCYTANSVWTRLEEKRNDEETDEE